MPLQFTKMDDHENESKLKLCLVGEEQNGKSRLASTARKPILVHDFDDKKESLEGIPGVYCISYVDPRWPNQPTAAQDFLTVLGRLETNLSLRALGFKNAPEDAMVRTNVIDSVQTLGKACQQYAMSGNKDLRREIKFGGHVVFVSAGWDAVNAEMGEVDNFVLRMLALPTDSIIILHETDEKAADSTPEKPKFTGRVGVYPPRYQMLLKYFPEVWRVSLTQVIKDGKSLYLPRVYPLPTHEFSSGTTMLLDSQEEPNIEAMLAKHVARKNGTFKELQSGQSGQISGQTVQSKETPALPSNVKI